MSSQRKTQSRQNEVRPGACPLGFLSRHHRGKIYNRMMTFARRINFKWHCLCVDKKYLNSSLQIVSKLQEQLDKFIAGHESQLSDVDRVKVYYDCGQSPVTKIL